MVTLVIMSSIGMAAVFTLTTTVAEMLEALEKALAPTARFGVPVEAISLAISLTIRLIPLQFATVGEVLDARDDSLHQARTRHWRRPASPRCRRLTPACLR